jgi:hypothetical protein
MGLRLRFRASRGDRPPYPATIETETRRANFGRDSGAAISSAPSASIDRSMNNHGISYRIDDAVWEGRHGLMSGFARRRRMPSMHTTIHSQRDAARAIRRTSTMSSRQASSVVDFFQRRSCNCAFFVTKNLLACCHVLHRCDKLPWADVRMCVASGCRSGPSDRGPLHSPNVPARTVNPAVGEILRHEIIT